MRCPGQVAPLAEHAECGVEPLSLNKLPGVCFSVDLTNELNCIKAGFDPAAETRCPWDGFNWGSRSRLSLGHASREEQGVGVLPQSAKNNGGKK
jgi:hypothetical protein